MCGIAGILALGGTLEAACGCPPERTLGRMLDALAHRGPDGTGSWADDRLSSLGRIACSHHGAELSRLANRNHPELKLFDRFRHRGVRDHDVLRHQAINPPDLEHRLRGATHHTLQLLASVFEGGGGGANVSAATRAYAANMMQILRQYPEFGGTNAKVLHTLRELKGMAATAPQ